LSNRDTEERKTVLRTIRIPKSLERSLKSEAADEGTTVNADINSILSRHFEWDKKAWEFRLVSLHKPILISLLEGLDEETLARIGREVVTASWKEMAEFWFQDPSPGGLLDALSMISKFDPNMRIRVTQEEGMYTVVFNHDLGAKWSIVAESAFGEFVKRSFHVEPRVTRGESVITARFKVNPPNSRS
jgi:hypothetical protein